MSFNDDRHSSTRLILLGASNLTRGISTIVETARLLLGTPLDVYAALGHGRSFGQRSTILFGVRSLPGIVDCGLWNALQASKNHDTYEHGQTFALITDIGNDIIYGVQPAQIAGWVEQCIDRLHHHKTKVAMTMLPIDAIRSVKPWQFAIVKSLLFPTHQLRFEDAIARADDLHDLIANLAQRRGVTVLHPRAQWYGFDPIHVRMRHWPTAWAEILGACSLKPGSNVCAPPSLARWMKLRTHMPERYWLLGREKRRQQPLFEMPGGLRISYF